VVADPRTIQQFLSEIGEGIACRHYHEPRTGIHFDLLAGLGLLLPIKTSVPPCDAHGCPLLGTCEYEADFASGTGRGAPKGNRKFRRATEGAAIAAEPALLERLVGEHPLAELVARVLRGGQASVFDLAHALLERDLAQVEEETETAPVVRRRELGAYLRLLEALGWIQLEDNGVTVRAVRLPGQPEPR
jgi:hypothetical protein